MGSKREEERNEKIIRGLMKLPPNRRCINCNSLGPQYVCTNFWTFVCTTCGGIHREFTHRVKSVSMSKFTSQEVEALQNGGNQRAREIYLKDWDQQRQRLPNNSNVDKVREFIKNVYVDKRYAGGKSADKPPRDLQRLGSHEDETRRASSYHSYSQSPPYDFQYEDRRYGKQAAVLTRKPGSDRGLYPGKMASFICSPTRLSERVLEDGFVNEGSVSRFSDYSVSSGGDPVRYGTESPNFQREIGYNSPPVQPSRDIVGENAQHQQTNLFSNFKRDSDVVPRSQRTASLGSVGSFESTSMSLKSYNSGGLVDVVSGPDEAAELHQDAASSFPPASTSVKNDSLDLFKDPGFPEPGSSATPQIDLFQLSASAMPVDLFQSSPSNLAPAISLNQSSSSTPHSSLDLFGEIVKQQPAIAMDKKSTETLVPKDEGWATFDTPQNSASMPRTENLVPSLIPSGVSSVKFEQVSSVNTSPHWAAFQNSDAQMSSSILGSDLWHSNNLHNVQAATNATGAQTWNAFDNSVTHLPAEGIKQFTEPQSKAYEPLSTADQYLGLRVSEGFRKDGIQRDASYGGFPGPSEVSEFVTRPSFAPSLHPLMEETQSHPSDQRSTNPFDLPYESDLEQSNMFLDMSSLQGALPNAQKPSAFIGTAPQQWFPQDPLMTYLPTAPQGGLAYMAGQTTNPQLANVQNQGPFTSVGGNPFA